MRLTKKLFGFLHRVFEKDPDQFLALRLRCDGSGLTWSIADAVLTTVPVGGTAAPLTLDLRLYTVASLAAYLGMQPGYSLSYVDGTTLVNLGAAVLIDGAGDMNASNGDHLYGYTSLLWSYMEANAVELQAAETQIGNMLLQMSTTTAEDAWLDELGGYYGVPRNQGELDSVYGPRIIAQVLRPLGNNFAIVAALRAINAGLPVSVDNYDTIVNVSYGLFDVNIEVTLEQLAMTAYATMLLSAVDTISRMRDAGTFLRQLAIITTVRADYYGACISFSGETDAIFPDLMPSMVLDFTTEGRSYSGLSCTRAGAATRWDSIGVLQDVSADQLRISKDPVSGLFGLLVEESRINGIRNNMANTNWSLQYGTGLTTSGYVNGIEDGVPYVEFTVNRNAGSPLGSILINLDVYSTQVAAQNQIWTASAYLKRVSGTLSGETCTVRCTGTNNIGQQRNVNTAVTVPTNAALKTQRSSVSVTLADSTTAYVYSSISINIPAGGAASSVFRIGLPQLELGEFVTSPIKTSGATATRAADVISMALGSWFNASEGTLNAQGNVATPSGGTRRLVQIGSGGDRIAVGLASTTSARFFVDSASVTQGDSSVTITSSAAMNKVAGIYKANDFIIAANNALGAADSSGTLPTVSSLYIGSDGGASQFADGHIRRLEYYPRRLTNTQLQFLTM